MYYLDMGSDGVDIRNSLKSRTVGQYVIYRGEVLLGQMAYRAHTIVRVDATGTMEWYKNRDRTDLAPLTKEEKDSIMLQILKSEVW